MGEHDPAADLPPTLRRLWGHEARPRRGPRPALTTEQILRAAAAIADADGLAAVSMARIGEALGYSAMALYRHVDGKDELLVLLADHIAAEIPTPQYPGDWREGLHAWARAQIEGLLARPWFLDLPLAAVQPGPNRVRWLDDAFRILRDVPVPADTKLAVVGLLSQHVLGEARVQLESARAAAATVRHSRGLPADAPESDLDPAEVVAANPFHDFVTALRLLADPAAYPDLAGAMAAEPPVATASATEDVEFGLTVVLDGIAAHLARNSPQHL
ncbi:TetR/AcrR family transcriptional regulator C-terminal domain-containing protein [Pseudonocardia nematodicida]|uniref:TetR/AcrR family transcriptional regulator C-terminal domain-containing protein n=1 Tax=Pseudonocardia nematodicida TaxID=1206997 RepID=A0ABV1KHN0_9PSEU